MRPASDVLSRLQWDPLVGDVNDIVIGYMDRFEGVKEISFSDWQLIGGDVTEEEFIPQHRIHYFKKRSDGEVLWDRKAKVDKIFGSV